MNQYDIEKQIKSDWQILANFLTEPKTRKQLEDELPILNMPMRLKRWVKEGKLTYYKDQWAYVYELAAPVEKTNSRIIRGFDTIRVSPRLSRERTWVAGSTLSGVF